MIGWIHDVMYTPIISLLLMFPEGYWFLLLVKISESKMGWNSILVMSFWVIFHFSRCTSKCSILVYVLSLKSWLQFWIWTKIDIWKQKRLMKVLRPKWCFNLENNNLRGLRLLCHLSKFNQDTCFDQSSQWDYFFLTLAYHAPPSQPLTIDHRPYLLGKTGLPLTH